MAKMTEQEFAALTQHLIELGCPLERSAGYRDTPGLKLEQVPSLGTNQVFDLDDGRAGFVMDVRIWSELNLPVRIRQVRIDTPWGLREIELLPDPAIRVSTYQYYDFPKSTLSFHREVVVNDFVSGRTTLKPGEQVQGLLLAVDDKPIPDEFPEQGRTEVNLVIFDERGNTFSSKFKLCVDRSASVVRERKIRAAAARQPKLASKRRRDAA